MILGLSSIEISKVLFYAPLEIGAFILIGVQSFKGWRPFVLLLKGEKSLNIQPPKNLLKIIYFSSFLLLLAGIIEYVTVKY